MRLIFIRALALIVTSQALQAAPGTVLTRDGGKLEGEIRFTNDALLVLSTSGPVTVKATNIARAQLSTNVLASQTPGNGNGLLGVYYHSTTFSGLAFTRLDATVDFRWPRHALAGTPDDNFSVRWSGYLQAPTTDSYTLYFATDDGGRIYLDGQLLADNWTQGGFSETNITVALRAGERRKLTLEHLELGGAARAHFAWSTPTMPKTIVPQNRLYAASFDPVHQADVEALAGEQGLLATYYNSPDFTSNSVSRVDREIDFDWNKQSPAPGIASNGFSVRWSGNLSITNAGEYKFFVYGGSPIRLSINDQLVSNPWIVPVQHMAAATLTPGDRCELRLEMRITNNALPVRLSWSGPGFEKSMIPRHHLSPTLIPTREAPWGSGPTLPEGIVLASGAVIAAPLRSASSTSIRFGGALAGQSVAVTRIARIYARPVTSEMAAAIPKGRSGVLLKNRDFIDGEFAGIDNGRLRIESVLFGSRTFDFAKDVVAVELRGTEATPWRYAITARDGTTLYGKALGLSPQRISLTEAKDISLPAGDVIEIVHRE